MCGMTDQNLTKKILNREITNNKINSIIKALLTKKNPGQDIFTVQFYQTLKEEIRYTPFKLLHVLKTLEYSQIHSMKLATT